MWDHLPGALKYQINFRIPGSNEAIPLECVGCDAVRPANVITYEACYLIPEDLRGQCFYWRVSAFCASTNWWSRQSHVACSRSGDDQGGPRSAVDLGLEKETENQFKVYPNPSNGILNVQFEKPINGNLKLEILDISGKLIQEVSFNQVYTNNVNLDLENTLQDGVYFLRFNSKESSQIQKIIIQKK